jgi:predicted site-specific integrase-resolvase
MKNKKIRCDIYTRVSTTMQVDGYSLDTQKEKLKRYAEFQNMEIVNEYSDEGKSGKGVEGRPEFQRMLDNIENGTDEVQFVLVFKLSRFGCNAADVLNAMQRMQDFGVNLICVEDGIDRENILVQTTLYLSYLYLRFAGSTLTFLPLIFACFIASITSEAYSLGTSTKV